jgi:hypothetical protein
MARWPAADQIMNKEFVTVTPDTDWRSRRLGAL